MPQDRVITLYTDGSSACRVAEHLLDDAGIPYRMLHRINDPFDWGPKYPHLEIEGDLLYGLEDIMVFVKKNRTYSSSA